MDKSQKMQNTTKPYFKVLFHQWKCLQKPYEIFSYEITYGKALKNNLKVITKPR
jgi:hypothetical protein